MDPLSRPVVLDGGLATTLQDAGLPLYTPVETWLLERPDAIRAAHAAFAEAGAEVLLTATFRSLPSERDDWEALVPRAIALAREAADGRAAVWLSLGPGGGHVEVVARFGGLVDGVVLETFVDGDAGLAALRSCDRVVPTVLSVTPIGVMDVARIAREAMDAGAAGFGLNCVPGPALVEAAARVPGDIPLWAKPNGGPGQREAFAALWRRARWLGGCCGTGPVAIAGLRGGV